MSILKQDSKSTLLASAAALSIIIASVGGSAFAQTATKEEAEKAKTTTATAAASETIVVKGIRASNQSAIARQKNSNTAMDSIVAEDVGSFPDRNVAEAISRVAGISIDRGEAADGGELSVRGQANDFTRIEIDGIGAATTSFSGAPNNNDAARNVDLRYLNSDLIKSIDVYKGATAELTQGGSSGTVLIQTRTGLDFTKPYFFLRVGGQKVSLFDEFNPDVSSTYTRKFFNNKVGMVLNGSYVKSFTGNDNVRNNNENASGGGNFGAGYGRMLDIDNSLEKTITHSAAGLGSAADVALASITRTNNSVFAYTPREIITASGAATTKEQCLALYPTLTTTDLNAFTGTTNRNNAASLQSFAQRTCLAQWYDYTPTLLRLSQNEFREDRFNADVRFDYKPFDSLNLYVKYAVANNNRQHEFQNLNIDTAATFSTATYTGTLNALPGSVVVDKNHFVTGWTNPATAGIGLDSADYRWSSDTTTITSGFNFKKGPWKADFVYGNVDSGVQFNFNRIGYFGSIGSYKVARNAEGLYLPDFTGVVDLTNPSDLATKFSTPNAAAPNTRQFTNTFTYRYDPIENESNTETFRLDVSRRITEIPFITRIATGASQINYSYTNYTGGGFNADNGAGGIVAVPAVNVRSTVVGCQSVGTSLCTYGVVPSGQNTATTLTPADLKYIIENSLYFNGNFLGGSVANVPEGWLGIDVNKALTFLDASKFNNDCLRVCTGADGKVYEKPKTNVDETVTSLYIHGEFSQKLPLGVVLDGNMGTRYVQTERQATGSLGYTIIEKTALFDPLNPGAAAGITSRTFVRNTSYDGDTKSWTPSYNLALKFLDGKLITRWNNSKVITQPRVGQLFPSGNCTFDERIIDLQDQFFEGGEQGDEPADLRCTGNFGNPALKPFNALNRNYTLEYYHSRDTYIKLSRYVNTIRVAGVRTVTLNNVDIFGDGREWTYNTYENVLGGKYSGWELAGKLGFDFLPWKLKYFGFDGNITKADPGAALQFKETYTGDLLPAQGVPDYSLNASLWYDDGKLNARLSYQRITERFSTITGQTGSGIMNYPMDFHGQWAFFRAGTTSSPYYSPGLQTWTPEVEYLDFKASYKFNQNYEVFIEARNVTETTAGLFQKGASFEDGAPVRNNYAYGGSRLNMGVNLRF